MHHNEDVEDVLWPPRGTTTAAVKVKTVVSSVACIYEAQVSPTNDYDIKRQ